MPLVLLTYVIEVLNGKEVVGMFDEKELQNTNQNEFRIKKLIKERVIKYMPNWKAMIIPLT